MTLLFCEYFQSSECSQAELVKCFPQCADVNWGYITGLSMNKSVVIAKVPKNLSQVFESICEIVNTPGVFLFQGQLSLGPNKKN